MDNALGIVQGLVIWAVVLLPAFAVMLRVLVADETEECLN